MALETERQYYDSVKPELLRHHEGKFVLIIGNEVLGAFDNPEEAYKAGLQQRGNLPMLIKQVLKNEPTESIPAVTLGLLSARL